MSKTRLIVTTTNAEPPLKGDLFAGTKFWVAQRCPSRQDYIKKITYNGGTIVPLEKQADILIVDYLRKDLPVNGVSYRLIDDSLKDAEFKDVDDYICGPRHHVRDVGSMKPARAGRTPFTTEDDLQLYKWVKDAENQGARIKGNELYKQLEQKNPRHSFQSWRDRYLKVLSIKPPSSALVDANPPLSPPTSDPQAAPQNFPRPRNKRPRSTGSVNEKPSLSQQEGQRAKSDSPRPSDEYAQSQSVPASAHKTSRVLTDNFTLREFNRLLLNAADVQNIPIGRYKEAWKAWANAYPPHTLETWKGFYEAEVLPVWEDLEVDQDVRLEQYTKAWEEWTEAHGIDQPIKSWLHFYHTQILPSFAEPVQSAEEEENKGPGVKTEDGAATARDAQAVGESPKSVTEKETKHAAKATSIETPAVSSEKDHPRRAKASDQHTKDLADKNPTEQEQASSATLGKRRRDDEEEEGASEAAPPPAKKRNLSSNNNSQVPFQTTQESVEQKSPKMARGTSDVASQDVIQISSAVPTSSSLQQSSSQSDFEPAQKEQHTQAVEEDEEPLEEEEEEDQDVGNSGVSEGRIRDVLDGLSKEHIEELLSVMRTVPAAPTDKGMDPFEAVVMHTVHFFQQINQADSQAVWDVGDTFQKIGLMDRFLETEVEVEEAEREEDGNEEEAAEDQQEKEIPTETDLEGTTKVDISQSAIAPTSGQEPPPVPSSTHAAITHSQPLHQAQRQQTPQHGPSEEHAEPSASTTQPTGTLTTDEALETYIATRLAAPHAYTEYAVLNALRATSANASLCDVALRHMRAHSGALPEMAGVWTARDDDSLQAGGMAARRAERKHGRERCVVRKGFLKEWGIA